MNILITREPDKSDKFAKLILDAGMRPFCLPMIECLPVEADIAGAYDYAVFTSLNAVKYFSKYRSEVSADKIVAVGSATKAALEADGFVVDMMPLKYSAEGLKRLFSDIDIAGKKFLMAGAETRAGDFHDWLKKEAADAEIATIYKTEKVDYNDGDVEKFISDNEIDVITFASPSAVRAFFGYAKSDKEIVCIGKTTYDAVKSFGYDAKYPYEYTLEGMIDIIKKLR